MKVGDKVPVQIGAHTVAQAEIKEMADGQAVLIVPATRVVMGVRSELTDLPTAAPEKEVIVDEVVRQEAPVAPEVAAPEIVETKDVQQTVTPPANNDTVVEVKPEAAVETPAPEAPVANE